MRKENLKTYKKEFDSMNQFYKYICDTPFNEAFRWANHASVESNYTFTGTKNYQEATELMKNGWTDMSKKITQRLKVEKVSTDLVKQAKTYLDVAGFQPIVPLYLSNTPCNMVNKKMVVVKQKIINITKLINYHCGITTEQIIESSIKSMQLVKLLEAKGYRVNLYVGWGVKAGDRNICGRVKIKGSNEKTNISKLAFPLVHPSMLRRLMFRFLEVNPDVTKDFVTCYGRPVEFKDMKNIYGEKEIILPALIDCDVSEIVDLQSIEARF